MFLLVRELFKKVISPIFRTVAFFKKSSTHCIPGANKHMLLYKSKGTCRFSILPNLMEAYICKSMTSESSIKFHEWVFLWVAQWPRFKKMKGWFGVFKRCSHWHLLRLPFPNVFFPKIVQQLCKPRERYGFFKESLRDIVEVSPCEESPFLLQIWMVAQPYKRCFA